MSDEEQLNHILGAGHVKYQDIISEQDIEFWKYLCNKDFKRLQKLLTQGLGDGIFFDDTDSDDSDQISGKLGSESDEEEDVNMQGRNKLSSRKGKGGNEKNDGYDEEDDFDHDGFMEQMLAEMHSAQEEEQLIADKKKKEKQEEEDREENERGVKQAKYNENQFWKVNDSYDLDDLMADYEN